VYTGGYTGDVEEQALIEKASAVLGGISDSLLVLLLQRAGEDGYPLIDYLHEMRDRERGEYVDPQVARAAVQPGDGESVTTYDLLQAELILTAAETENSHYLKALVADYKKSRMLVVGDDNAAVTKDLAALLFKPIQIESNLLLVRLQQAKDASEADFNQQAQGASAKKQAEIEKMRAAQDALFEKLKGAASSLKEAQASFEKELLKHSDLGPNDPHEELMAVIAAVAALKEVVRSFADRSPNGAKNQIAAYEKFTAKVAALEGAERDQYCRIFLKRALPFLIISTVAMAVFLWEPHCLKAIFESAQGPSWLQDAVKEVYNNQLTSFIAFIAAVELPVAGWIIKHCKKNDHCPHPISTNVNAFFKAHQAPGEKLSMMEKLKGGAGDFAKRMEENKVHIPVPPAKGVKGR
jgi:hypothetical protein